MGAYHCMEREAVRLGRARKREKAARRAAEARCRMASVAAAIKPMPTLAATKHDLPSPLRRVQERRKREAKYEAEARRLKQDMAVVGPIKDLFKGIRESIALIDRAPRDEKGRIRAHDVTEEGVEFTFFEKPSRMFKRFTADERHALSVTARKNRAAAKRLAISIAAARSAWEATLAEYVQIERSGSPSTREGRL